MDAGSRWVGWRRLMRAQNARALGGAHSEAIGQLASRSMSRT